MSDRPNILWLMTDEQRADSLSYNGASWARTPNLDRVALRGTRFSSAYTPSPVCVSARSCILTGRYGSSIGMLNNHHRMSLDDPQFLPWTFAANGYQVASFGKQHYNSHRQAFDFEHRNVLGDRVHYFEYQVPVDAAEAGIVRYDGGEYPWLFAGRFPGTVDDTPEMHSVDRALDWMRGRDPSRPYFLRLSLNAPHTPVVTPAPFDTLIDADAIDLPVDWSQDMAFSSGVQQDYLCDYGGTHRLTEGQIRRARQCYYGCVACVDYVFGKLLDTLEAAGELENTIIAFVADHGTHLGDHGFFQKQSFWEPSVHVPLFFAGPGIQDRTVAAPVSAGSLLPTLLDLVDLPVPAQVQFPSLCPQVAPGAAPHAAASQLDVASQATAPVFSEIDYGEWHYRLGDRYVMVRDGQWKLCLYRDPRDHDRHIGVEDRVLFDLETDPDEYHNLASDPAYAPVVAQLVAKIDAWDRERPIVEPTLADSHR